MEFINHQEDDDRVNSISEEPEDVMGKGRSYECMFCKRGFTTAQALGGHMNIHRKDRAKNIRPPPNYSSTKYNIEQDTYNFAGPDPKIYQPVFSSYPHQYYNVAHEPQFQYQAYFPCTSSHLTTRANYDQNRHLFEPNQRRIISPCGEDLRLGLSLQLGSCYGEDGLDLELRLGHN